MMTTRQTMMMPVAVLKPGREKSLLKRHPWVFSGAIAQYRGDPGIGDTIRVEDRFGKFLGWGAYSPHSKIRVRIYSWNEAQTPGRALFANRLAKAIEYRQLVLKNDETNAFRLVHAESDGVPGLIVDRYGDVLVMQVLSAGIEKWREEIADILRDLTGVDLIYERSDAEVRKLEGLPIRTGLLAGESADGYVSEIKENGLRFQVDIAGGHKTGFYLDQRENRAFVRAAAAGKAVLDCFSYTGGFTLAALKGDATSVVSVETSAAARSLAEENIRLNELDAGKVTFLDQDVFIALRKFRDKRARFDMIILDPPKFAPTAAQAAKAARGYKDINLLALKLLNPGGRLVTFSCSGGISAELFGKIVAGAAVDAGVDGRITKRLYQSADHPVSLAFPEGLYLKGLVIDLI